MKTGNTTRRPDDICKIPTPQWSPVMKTGNTCGAALAARTERQASMEPGHEDREYPADLSRSSLNSQASMEPGHEDREYA